MPERYFDHAATTPVDSRVREAMLPFLGEQFGNANSIHSLGRAAMTAVERAAAQLASLLGCEPEQLYFTSGATEANNWVLNAADQIIISPFEHSAMREPAFRRKAWIIEHFGGPLLSHSTAFSTKEGSLQPRRAIRRCTDAWPTDADTELDMVRHTPDLNGRILTSVMSANNETGMCWTASKYARQGDLVHSDITQSVGKIFVNLERLNYASLSAHKFYGPKGVGALYCRDFPPEPLIVGGEQQHDARGGTLNVPGIVGMGAAAEVANDRMEPDYLHALELRQILREGLAGVSDVQWNEMTSDRGVMARDPSRAEDDTPSSPSQSPYIASLSFLDLEGETLVIELDHAGYAVSSGAACSSASAEPSHVLTALGLEPEWLRGTIRVSFGRANTKESTRHLAHEIRIIAEKLRKI